MKLPWKQVAALPPSRRSGVTSRAATIAAAVVAAAAAVVIGNVMARPAMPGLTNPGTVRQTTSLPPIN